MLGVKLVVWLLAWRQLSVVLLIVLAVISSLGVVYTAHETRATYAQLQNLQETRDSLESRYDKLLLEQSAWSDYSRVDQISRNQLKMSSPKLDDIVVVKR